MMQPNPHATKSFSAYPEHIVVDDPQREFLDGSLVDATRAHQLRARGVATLPVISDLFVRSGVGGFFKRSWGSGYPLARATPCHHCPMSLYLDASMMSGRASGKVEQRIHWCARLTRSPIRETPHGVLRFAVDTGQAHQSHASALSPVVPVDLSRLGDPDGRGGWTVGGDAAFAVPMRGHYGFSLYGMGPGLRVAWSAASVTLE